MISLTDLERKRFAQLLLELRIDCREDLIDDYKRAIKLDMDPAFAIARTLWCRLLGYVDVEANALLPGEIAAELEALEALEAELKPLAQPDRTR